MTTTKKAASPMELTPIGLILPPGSALTLRYKAYAASTAEFINLDDLTQLPLVRSGMFVSCDLYISFNLDPVSLSLLIEDYEEAETESDEDDEDEDEDEAPRKETKRQKAKRLREEAKAKKEAAASAVVSTGTASKPKRYIVNDSTELVTDGYHHATLVVRDAARVPVDGQSMTTQIRESKEYLAKAKLGNNAVTLSAYLDRMAEQLSEANREVSVDNLSGLQDPITSAPNLDALADAEQAGAARAAANAPGHRATLIANYMERVQKLQKTLFPDADDIEFDAIDNSEATAEMRNAAYNAFAMAYASTVDHIDVSAA